jgi:hypothetical protein
MKISMNKKNIFFSLLLLTTTNLFSQGLVESVLSTNGVLINKYHELKLRSSYRAGGSITDTLMLGTKGFIDDFSNEGPYPDTAKWLDNYVYVNRTLPIAPITIGAATFDGVNANGYPYDFNAAASSSGKADTLTSKPIDLYLPNDTSVYFSFYYQQKGRGDKPHVRDSIILEFKDATPFTSNPWKHVWKGIATATSDSSWKYVSIHITNPNFLKKGFQFRFSNYATLSGTFDNWHIDYVYLNKNRTATDSVTILNDITFVYNTPPLITKFSEMPWRHYNPSLMKSTYSTTIRNNNDAIIFGDFGYNIYDNNNALVSAYTPGGPINYEKFSAIGYDNVPARRSPPLSYTIPALTERTKYRIETFLFDISPGDNRVPKNDTVNHIQDFNNYFAYDDGTAETSFGLMLSPGTQGDVAEKFSLTVADTLRAIDIYFNPQLVNATVYPFRLKVWSASGSSPGSVIFTSVDSLYVPRYNKTGTDKFTRYYLETPVALAAGSSFFIGFQQNTIGPINIGIDLNTNTQSLIYYSVSGSWSTSPYLGSIMMHPVLGSASDVVGVDSEPLSEKNKFSVYPNPANDKLFVRAERMNLNEPVSYMIVDIYGRKIAENNIKDSEIIDIAAMSSGVYFIRITSETTISTHKFIISR